MANTYRTHNLTYTSFVTDSALTNMTENLKREVGLDHAGKYTQEFYSIYRFVSV